MISRRSQVQLGGIVFMLLIVLLSNTVVREAIVKIMPIRYVQVAGAFQYIDKQDIKKKISPLLQAGYFSVDLAAVQQAVLSLPWTDKVKVERIWPDSVKLRIYEQQPVVRWQEDALLNAAGDIFKPGNIDRFQSLAVLYAPIEQRKELLNVMDGLKLGLSDHGLHLTEFRVSDRQSWLLRMENGMVIQLGRFQPIQKFTLLMQALVVKGAELVAKIAYIDMRYPNGYTVRWRKDAQISW